MVAHASNSEFLQLTHLTLLGTRFTSNGVSISIVVSCHCPVLQNLHMEDVRGVTTVELVSHSLEQIQILYVEDIEMLGI